MSTDEYERFLGDFGRELERAAEKSRRARLPLVGKAPRRGSRLLVAPAAAAVAAAVALVVVALPHGGGSRLDIVAQARAALSPAQGELVHLVVRLSSRAVQPPGAPKMHVTAQGETIEQWSTADPPRWRAVLSTKTRRGTPIVSEVAYADGTETSYTHGRHVVRVVHGLGDGAPPPLPGLLPGNDPVAEIRSMLKAGRLHDAGAATVDGRSVRRLTGTAHRRFGRATVTTSVEYDVDPQTFTPVAAQIETPLPPDIRHTTMSRLFIVLRFTRYRQVPLDDQTSRLLEIHPPRHLKVVETTAPRRLSRSG